jgi:CubicO group peptidase (beta-lactamase class C family)
MRLIVLSLVVALLQARGLPPTADQFFASLGDYLESLRVQAGIPGLAAAVVGPDGVVWERAFGRQDLERAIATTPDTPFHLDGLTQLFTAAVVLRCVEEGRLSLDDRIARFSPDNSEANATIRQLLTHTAGASGSLAFAYRLDRLDPLKLAIRSCTGDSFRETLANLLDRLAMRDSVPGADVVNLAPPAEGIPDGPTARRYAGVLSRLATPYAVDARGQASPSSRSSVPLSPAGGLISTVRDIAQFDLALKTGVLLRAATLADAWRPPVGSNGQTLPHGIGWFVQSYNGETIVWQFGVNENASSSLVVTVPARGFTLILLANSDGLVKPFGLAAGDVTASPFARLFLGLFGK